MRVARLQLKVANPPPLNPHRLFASRLTLARRPVPVNRRIIARRTARVVIARGHAPMRPQSFTSLAVAESTWCQTAEGRVDRPCFTSEAGSRPCRGLIDRVERRH